jgi:hypothetical protein
MTINAKPSQRPTFNRLLARSLSLRNSRRLRIGFWTLCDGPVNHEEVWQGRVKRGLSHFSLRKKEAGEIGAHFAATVENKAKICRGFWGGSFTRQIS